MLPMIISAKPVVDELTKNLQQRVGILKEHKIQPKLTIFTSSSDDASKVYVRNKLKKCEEVGIEATTLSIKDLHINSDYFLNNQPFIIQQPCDISQYELADLLDIHARCDVDGFSSVNLGKIFVNSTPYFYPCTPAGIIKLFEAYNYDLNNAYITVVGRSNIVGKPLAVMLENKYNATVALCHSHTDSFDLEETIKHSDFVISAVGKHDIYTHLNIDWRYKVLIDVGMNRDAEGKLCGDFSKKQLDNCLAYTPVPGGIGPMTVISLCENVVNFYEKWII